jgi:hypothetical protein
MSFRLFGSLDAYWVIDHCVLASRGERLIMRAAS